MRVTRETYSAWGSKIETLTILCSSSRTFKAFAEKRGATIEPGQGSFEVKIDTLKYRYIKQ